VLTHLAQIDLEDGVAATLENLPTLLRTIAHDPRVIGTSSLLDRGSLERRYCAIAIVRTTVRCACEYEWRDRVSFLAANVALRKTEMASLAYGGASDPAWSPVERSLIRLVDELHDTGRISDALRTELHRHWTDAEIVELLVIVGFYHAISFVVNGLGLQLESRARS